MAKVRLGARPQNFKRVVRFPMIDPATGAATEGAIEVSYKYRTRSEFGEFIDRIVADAKAKAEADQAKAAADEAPETFSLKAFMERTAGSNADYILDVADGWNVVDVDDRPVEFSREAVQQLANEMPAAAAEIMETYRVACSEGRVKN